jgi:hypothetical protein
MLEGMVKGSTAHGQTECLNHYTAISNPEQMPSQDAVPGTGLMGASAPRRPEAEAWLGRVLLIGRDQNDNTSQPASWR